MIKNADPFKNMLTNLSFDIYLTSSYFHILIYTFFAIFYVLKKRASI